eukprot:snap_masked-scaffold_5-processed-gene-19.30-mRNA-1 protein AED:1.00 eAED:1.00 QI:0/0/0/0/1/1/3/0/366
MGFCEAPLLKDKETGNCTSSVYEYYDPAAEILLLIGTVTNLLLCVATFATLLAYIRKMRHLRPCVKQKSPSTRNEKHLFKQNVVTLVAMCIGLAGVTFYTSVGGLIRHEFAGRKGKVIAFSVYTSFVLLIASNYYFLPVLKSLLGSSDLSATVHSAFKLVQYIGMSLNFSSVILIGFLIFLEAIDLSQYLTIIFIFYDIVLTLLIVLCSMILSSVIAALKHILTAYAKKDGTQIKTQKLNTLYKKLQFYNVGVRLQVVVLVSLSISFMLPSMNTRSDILLFHAVYITFAPLGLVPLLSVYSRFIIPGSDRCFSYSYTESGEQAGGSSMNAMKSSSLECISPVRSVEVFVMSRTFFVGNRIRRFIVY